MQTAALPTNPHPLSDMQRSVGSGSLSVKQSGGRTRLHNLHQQGCAKIRLPRVHETTGMQAVLINSSGGMTGGDVLDWDFELRGDTGLTITTQACERIYKSSGGEAQTRVTIRAYENARLAWLPQETILFDEGRFTRTIEAELSVSSEALFVESVIFGRKAMGEIVENGFLRDRWRIRHGGRLLHAEDFRLDGEVNAILTRNSAAGGDTALATILLIAPRGEPLLSEVRKLAGAAGDASFWNGKLLVRLVAPDGFSLRRKLVPLINLLNSGAPLPRIWTM